jgi:hypothetical protein
MGESNKMQLFIDDDIWNKFKDKVPRSISLNDKVVELIKDYIKQK